jgi:hypothetical protein
MNAVSDALADLAGACRQEACVEALDDVTLAT